MAPHSDFAVDESALFGGNRGGGDVAPDATRAEQLNLIADDVTPDGPGDGDILGVDVCRNARRLTDKHVSFNFQRPFKGAIEPDVSLTLELALQSRVGTEDRFKADWLP